MSLMNEFDLGNHLGNEWDLLSYTNSNEGLVGVDENWIASRQPTPLTDLLDRVNVKQEKSSVTPEKSYGEDSPFVNSDVYFNSFFNSVDELNVKKESPGLDNTGFVEPSTDYSENLEGVECPFDSFLNEVKQENSEAENVVKEGDARDVVQENDSDHEELPTKFETEIDMEFLESDPDLDPFIHKMTKQGYLVFYFEDKNSLDPYRVLVDKDRNKVYLKNENASFSTQSQFQNGDQTKVANASDSKLSPEPPNEVATTENFPSVCQEKSATSTVPCVTYHNESVSNENNYPQLRIVSEDEVRCFQNSTKEIFQPDAFPTGNHIILKLADGSEGDMEIQQVLPLDPATGYSKGTVSLNLANSDFQAVQPFTSNHIPYETENRVPRNAGSNLHKKPERAQKPSKRTRWPEPENVSNSSVEKLFENVKLLGGARNYKNRKMSIAGNDDLMDFVKKEGLKKKVGHKVDGIVKPYVCPVEGCSAAYKNPNGIKYHAQYAHGPCFKIPCLCQKIYFTEHGLAAHLRTKTNKPDGLTHGRVNQNKGNCSSVRPSTGPDINYFNLVH